jgi:hypothetical protein
MALVPNEPSPLAKDTTPRGGRSVKYRVLQTTYVNGAIVQPQSGDGEDSFVMAPPGLHGGALEQVEPALKK